MNSANRRRFLRRAAVAGAILLPGFPVTAASGANPAGAVITAEVNRTALLEGRCVVASAVAKSGAGAPLRGLRLRAFVNGKPWCASQTTLPSGVVHLLLPLPEPGHNVITVRGGGAISNPVSVEVKRRQYRIITDPKHLIGMEWETWFGPGYARWGQEEAEPVLGDYSSLDPRVLRQQTLWFNRMGINFVELDWTNNLTKPFPDAPARECIAATNALFHLYTHMRQHPRIVFMLGPEHNLFVNNHATAYTGPWFFQQLGYVYRHYVNNPKYRGLCLRYLGKPLLLLYLNGPNPNQPPPFKDPRFTIRWVSAWLQWTNGQRWGDWSWYDQHPTPTYSHEHVESLTVTDGYMGHSPGPGLNPWLSLNAGGKNYGQTYRAQWRLADRYRPRFLFLCQWNEFEPPDQYSVNLSNDMEPTLIGGPGPKRQGWGFTYLNLTRREIGRYHRIIAALGPARRSRGRDRRLHGLHGTPTRSHQGARNFWKTPGGTSRQRNGALLAGFEATGEGAATRRVPG